MREAERAVAVLAVRLEDLDGNVVHRNFTTFVVDAPALPAHGTRAVSVPAASFSECV